MHRSKPSAKCVLHTHTTVSVVAYGM